MHKLLSKLSNIISDGFTSGWLHNRKERIAKTDACENVNISDGSFSTRIERNGATIIAEIFKYPISY